MSDDVIKIEVDGKTLEAHKGQMLIEVTDKNDIYVPRFCYHNKLSVAANCRMCLVEVEKAPKPLPACATPVMDGMVVKTKSGLALEAQKSVMEFLLINHPLDCPICDQGGECELQDLAMGYGSDVSRYQEQKRVVKDKNIGPLVQTEMTRCIHCTRCVRFGEELAGLRELGATGRGEHMEIGTYIEKSMVSELSGNVIDLCPVGALTSKPFRYSARTWEMTQQPGIAPHDGIGSNIHFHIKQDRVKRVVPAENEAINEVWLSDRDRFSYEGMYSDDRLLAPMIKQDGQWQEVDWETAFDFARQQLQNVISKHGADKLGTLVSPTSTNEELFLIQKLLRKLGSNNIDHRLHRADFSDQGNDPVFPWLGQSIKELEELNAALIIGGHPRKQQPLLNLRLRKAALKGADIMFLNPVAYDVNYRVSEQLVTRPGELCCSLAGVLKALIESTGSNDDTKGLLNDITVSDSQRAIANKLKAGDKATVLLGNLAQTHPHYSTLRYLAAKIANLSDATFGFLGEAANSAGACIAGALPHRGPGNEKLNAAGMDVISMFENKLPAWLLLNIEPETDCNHGRLARQSLQNAEAVIAITPYKTDELEDCATVLLPMALFAENEGSYINNENVPQAFSSAISAAGEARPAWKILRMLASILDVSDLDYDNVTAIQAEIDGFLTKITPLNQLDYARPQTLPVSNGAVQRITDMPMNACDTLVRRAESLQKTADAADGLLHINPALAENLNLNAQGNVVITQNDTECELAFIVDERLPENTVLLHAGHPRLSGLGEWFAEVSVRKV